MAALRIRASPHLDIRDVGRFDAKRTGLQQASFHPSWAYQHISSDAIPALFATALFEMLFHVGFDPQDCIKASVRTVVSPTFDRAPLMLLSDAELSAEGACSSQIWHLRFVHLVSLRRSSHLMLHFFCISVVDVAGAHHEMRGVLSITMR